MADVEDAPEGEVALEWEIRGGLRVARLEIRRSARANALSSRLMDAFAAKAASLAGDADLRAVIVTGAGETAFVGGADIAEMAALAGPDAARAFITRVHRCCRALRELPVPVIARINGNVFGAGLELAAACDVRVAVDTALFGMPEVRLGVPSVVEAALLPTLIGWGRTRELLLFGEIFTVDDAGDWGLFERIVDPEDLDPAIDEWLAQLAACAPGAVRLQKALMRRWEEQETVGGAIRAGIDSFAEAYASEEPRAAMAAFLARRRAGRSES